jgi:hypothetical protein
MHKIREPCLIYGIFWDKKFPTINFGESVVKKWDLHPSPWLYKGIYVSGWKGNRITVKCLEQKITEMDKKKSTLWTLSGSFNFSLTVNLVFQIVEEEHNV